MLAIFVFLQSFTFASAPVLVKPDERIDVKASETERLNTLLRNQKVKATLMDGTLVSGKVKEVRNGNVVVNVGSSSGATTFGRGDQEIAAERFSTIEITSFKGSKRGIFAAALGAAGLALGFLIGASESDSLGGEGAVNGTGAAVIAAAAVGGAAAGYAIGRNMDKKRLIITIVK